MEGTETRREEAARLHAEMMERLQRAADADMCDMTGKAAAEFVEWVMENRIVP